MVHVVYNLFLYAIFSFYFIKCEISRLKVTTCRHVTFICLVVKASALFALAIYCRFQNQDRETSGLRRTRSRRKSSEKVDRLGTKWPIGVKHKGEICVVLASRRDRPSWTNSSRLRAPNPPVDENIVQRKRLDTLEMCKIFNDGMKYSDNANAYEKRFKRSMPSDGGSVSIEAFKKPALSVETSQENIVCSNLSRCFTLKNDMNYPSEIPDQVGMTTDFAPRYLLGPESTSASHQEEDPFDIPWPKRWKYGIVPYFIDPKTYDSFLGEAIIKAFDYFEKSTCIRLQRLRERPTDKASLQQVEWLYITNPTGIRQCVHTNDQKANNGVQMVVFGYDCMNLGEIVHEIMHVLGFSHEHVRPKRDDHVHILWNNIKPGYKKYFMKRNEDLLADFPYDYSSVMHYPTRAFSRNGQLTIVSKTMFKIGQRIGLSQIDTQKVNYIYSMECLKRNKQYLQTTCPVVIESNTEMKPNNKDSIVKEEDIREYFKDRLWPFGIIYYKFRDNMEFSIEERDNIAAVIRHIERETCLKFRDISVKKVAKQSIDIKNKNNNKMSHLGSNETVETDFKTDKGTSYKQSIDIKNKNKMTHLGSNETVETDFKTDKGTSEENLPSEKNSKENSTATAQIRHKKKVAAKENTNLDRFPYDTQSVELSNTDHDEKNNILSDSTDYSNNSPAKYKKSASKITSGRRHATNILIFVRSDTPGCKCPKPGKPDGDEILSISVECFNSVNDLLHLFVHILGLEHQHNMHDRDSYLRIMWDKLSPETRMELMDKLPPAASLGLPYDYQSVMHYPWLEIKNGQSNIMYPIWNDGWAMGHWQGLSSTDVRKLNTLYSHQCDLRKKMDKFML